jgi:hypothetical protein
MELTLSIPDELASRLEPIGDRLPRILELGLREMDADSGTFAGLSDVLEVLARLPSPSEVLAMRPSAALQDHIDALLAKNRNGGLSEAERTDWQRYLYVEHLVRVAKAEALLKLSGKSRA